MDDAERDRLLRRIDNNVRSLLALAGASVAQLAQLEAAGETQEEQMATLAEITDDLVAKVEPLENAVEAGAAALDAFGQQVLDLLAQIASGGLTPEIEAQLTAVGQAMTTSGTVITEAVLRNTPAAPVP